MSVLTPVAAAVTVSTSVCVPVTVAVAVAVAVAVPVAVSFYDSLGCVFADLAMFQRPAFRRAPVVR